ncbi:MAG: pyruvate kinase alpha/beta domain-containing protein [Anaerolineae bacterium]
MSEITIQTVYFENPGRQNTERTLGIAKKRANELGIKTILVASTTGETGVLAAKIFQGYNLIIITHSTGFKEPNFQELTPENRAAIEKSGAKILTCMHAFGGVGRAVRKKLGTYELEEIVAYTLRIFGEGLKVACEMALMAADAGLVRTDEEVIVIAGTGRGADTAVLLRPANAQTFFDMRIIEILCMPGGSTQAR